MGRIDLLPAIPSYTLLSLAFFCMCWNSAKREIGQPLVTEVDGVIHHNWVFWQLTSRVDVLWQEYTTVISIVKAVLKLHVQTFILFFKNFRKRSRFLNILYLKWELALVVFGTKHSLSRCHIPWHIHGLSGNACYTGSGLGISPVYRQCQTQQTN